MTKGLIKQLPPISKPPQSFLEALKSISSSSFKDSFKQTPLTSYQALKTVEKAAPPADLYAPWAPSSASSIFQTQLGAPLFSNIISTIGAFSSNHTSSPNTSFDD